MANKDSILITKKYGSKNKLFFKLNMQMDIFKDPCEGYVTKSYKDKLTKLEAPFRDLRNGKIDLVFNEYGVKLTNNFESISVSNNSFREFARSHFISEAKYFVILKERTTELYVYIVKTDTGYDTLVIEDDDPFIYDEECNGELLCFETYKEADQFLHDKEKEIFISLFGEEVYKNDAFGNIYISLLPKTSDKNENIIFIVDEYYEEYGYITSFVSSINENIINNDDFIPFTVEDIPKVLERFGFLYVPTYIANLVSSVNNLPKMDKYYILGVDSNIGIVKIRYPGNEYQYHLMLLEKTERTDISYWNALPKDFEKALTEAFLQEFKASCIYSYSLFEDITEEDKRTISNRFLLTHSDNDKSVLIQYLNKLVFEIKPMCSYDNKEIIKGVVMWYRTKDGYLTNLSITNSPYDNGFILDIFEFFTDLSSKSEEEDKRKEE